MAMGDRVPTPRLVRSDTVSVRSRGMAGIQLGSVGEWVAGVGTISAVWFAARISRKERERADLKQEADGLDACSEWLAKLWTRLTRGETISVGNEDYGATVVRAIFD